MQLQGKVAVITGAASGIGLATAALFTELGATVIGVDANKDRIPQLAELGPRCTLSIRTSPLRVPLKK